MKFSQKYFVILCALLALIIIVTGLTIDFKGYLGNILAEIAGIFLGAIVVLLLVDRHTEYQQRKRWRKVRQLTHQVIASHLNNIIIEAFNHFPIKDHKPITAILDSRRRPSLDTLTAVNDLIVQLQQAKLSSESVIEYYTAIKWDINQIRQDLIPRVMQSSDDQDLINTLVDFDDTVQELQSKIIVYKKLIQQDISSNILILLEKEKKIYEILIKRWE